MNDSRKGRACIISLPTFEHPSLGPLDGYVEDAYQLGQLWENMGFDSCFPSIKAERSLTAEVSTN